MPNFPCRKQVNCRGTIHSQFCHVLLPTWASLRFHGSEIRDIKGLPIACYVSELAFVSYQYIKFQKVTRLLAAQLSRIFNIDEYIQPIKATTQNDSRTPRKMTPSGPRLTDKHTEFALEHELYIPATYREEDFNKLRTLSEHYAALEVRNTNLLASVEGGTFKINSLRDALNANTATLYELKESLNSSLRTWPLSYRSATQVTKKTQELLLDSPKLSQKLGFQLDGKGFLSTAFEAHNSEGESVFANFEVAYETIQHPPNQKYYTNGVPKDMHCVSIMASFSQFKLLPNIGSRCRSMLISQPPVRVMQVTVSCCEQQRQNGMPGQAPRRWAAKCNAPNTVTTYFDDEEDDYLDDESVSQNDVTASFEIKTRTGITVGDVYDAACKLREAHLLCPNATAQIHDEQGRVCPDIRFYSDVAAKSDDPYLVHQAMTKAQTDLDRVNETASKQAFDVYLRAKRTGEYVVRSVMGQGLTKIQRGRTAGKFRHTRRSKPTRPDLRRRARSRKQHLDLWGTAKQTTERDR